MKIPFRSRRRKPQPPVAPTLPASPLDGPNAAPKPVIVETKPDVRIDIPGTRGGQIVIKAGDLFGRADYTAPPVDDEAAQWREGARAMARIAGLL